MTVLGVIASMRVCSQQYAFVFSFIVFRIHVIVENSFENKLVKTRCASISHTIDNYVIATTRLRQTFYNKRHYSIFVETNAVHSICNFILSIIAEEISDVLLTQRTQVLRQRFSTLQRLHLMLNRRRERIVRGQKHPHHSKKKLSFWLFRAMIWIPNK